MNTFTKFFGLLSIAILFTACVESKADSVQSEAKPVTTEKQSHEKEVVHLSANPLKGDALVAKLSGMLDAEPYTQAEIEKNAMINYAIDHKLDIQTAPGGLFYVVTKMGDEKNYPAVTSKVKAHYHGTLLNGDKFDSSYDRGQPLEFPINRVVVGWQIAIPMLSIGTKATFLIPSSKAYGSRASGKIPANSPLVFDIELLGFN